MNLLIIGSGGREHALALAYAKSKRVKKVFAAPGNDLMPSSSKKITIVPQLSITDIKGLILFAKKQNIDLVDVAQDDPLAAGFVDIFEKEGFKTFGPHQNAAQIEWSKEWARSFMKKYKLPIPDFATFTNTTKALSYVEKLPEQVLYIKASGLAAGKGAIRANNKQEAKEAILSMQQFGVAGETFLIEQCMTGEEFSLFAICDGKNYKIIKAAQDHKTVYEKDQGPNTGGMGCVAPASVVTPKMIQTIEDTILKPFMRGMQQEDRPYSGILYVGGMITPKGIQIVEFNARWGDPETEVILPSITTDYLIIAQTVIAKKLQTLTIRMDKKVRISIAGCSYGYPNDYSQVKGKRIFGLEKAAKLPGITIYGAGIKKQSGHFVANGGRIFHIVSEGKTIQEARQNAYSAMALISIEGNNLHYRTDIGWRDVERIFTN